MLAKSLAGRSLGIEPVEHILKPSRRDARAVILHGQAGLALIVSHQTKGDVAVLRCEGHGISQKVVEDLDNPAILRLHHHRPIRQRRNQPVGRGCVAPRRDKILHQVRQVKGLRRLGRHLVIKPAGA